MGPRLHPRPRRPGPGRRTAHAAAPPGGRPVETSTYDAVVVGAAPNGLVAAAELAAQGWAVAVVGEQEAPPEHLASSDLTLPGHLHDAPSLWHLHFAAGPGYGALAADLRRHGLEYATGTGPLTATVGETGTAVAYRDPGTTAAGFDDPRDGPAYVGLLRGTERLAEEVNRSLGAGLLPGELFALGTAGLRVAATSDDPQVGRAAAMTARDLLGQRFRGDEVARLWMPWLRLLGLGPDDALGGLLLPATMLAAHEVGVPVVRGGASRFSEAMHDLLAERGVDLMLDDRVDSVEVRDGRAVAVHVGHQRLEALGAVLTTADPAHLHGTLLDGGDADPRARAGDVPVRRIPLPTGSDPVALDAHLALGRGVAGWDDERLRECPVVHVERPGEAPLVVVQPTVLDPDRAPEGRSTLWMRLETTAQDARDPAAALGRALAEVERFAPGLGGAVTASRVAVLELATRRAPETEHEGGRYRALDDWRPGVGAAYRTGVAGLYHLGVHHHPVACPTLGVPPSGSPRLLGTMTRARVDDDTGPQHTVPR